MEKQILKGKVEFVSKEQTYKRRDGSLLKKITLKISINDSQSLYCEVRNNKILSFKQQGIQEGDTITFKFLFQSSEKDRRYYNNIVIFEIKKL